MRGHHLPPLPETLAAWQVAGCPDVFTEVREGTGCWLVGTVEIAWDGPGHPVPVVRIRESIAIDADDLDRPSVELPGAVVVRRPNPRLVDAIDRAERARRRSIRPCADCREPTPPEHGARLDHGFTCHGCMERNHGVVF